MISINEDKLITNNSEIHQIFNELHGIIDKYEEKILDYIETKSSRSFSFENIENLNVNKINELNSKQIDYYIDIIYQNITIDDNLVKYMLNIDEEVVFPSPITIKESRSSSLSTNTESNNESLQDCESVTSTSMISTSPIQQTQMQPPANHMKPEQLTIVKRKFNKNGRKKCNEKLTMIQSPRRSKRIASHSSSNSCSANDNGRNNSIMAKVSSMMMNKRKKSSKANNKNKNTDNPGNNNELTMKQQSNKVTSSSSLSSNASSTTATTVNTTDTSTSFTVTSTTSKKKKTWNELIDILNINGDNDDDHYDDGDDDITNNNNGIDCKEINRNNNKINDDDDEHRLSLMSFASRRNLWERRSLNSSFKYHANRI